MKMKRDSKPLIIGIAIILILIILVFVTNKKNNIVNKFKNRPLSKLHGDPERGLNKNTVK